MGINRFVFVLFFPPSSFCSPNKNKNNLKSTEGPTHEDIEAHIQQLVAGSM